VFTAREELNIQIEWRLILEFKYLMSVYVYAAWREEESMHSNTRINYGETYFKEYLWKIGTRRIDVYNNISVIILW
jgi:hypothetical protein